MTICFAGLAGLDKSPNQTIDWLTEVIQSTSRSGCHQIEKHLSNIALAANDYITGYIKKRVQSDALRLAIFATGWIGTKEYGEVQYNYIIDNCIDKHWSWAAKARPTFISRFKHWGNAKFTDGYHVAFLGNDRLALKQRALLKILGKYAKEENPKKIFECSVDIIRAAAKESNGSIGNNCSGIRSSKGDLGIEVFDERVDVNFGVMPNMIKSTSNISMSLTNTKIYKG